MRISDWSSDVCSSDLRAGEVTEGRTIGAAADIEDVAREPGRHVADLPFHDRGAAPAADLPADRAECCEEPAEQFASGYHDGRPRRSEEHTSELQSLMRISYAVFCLKKKNHTNQKKRINNVDIEHTK